MTQFTRKNAWNNQGTFDNPDLLWYAKGVREMQSRPVSDPTSWWFYAAIHGEFLLPSSLIPPPPPPPDYTYLNWVNISYISPEAQLNGLPSLSQIDTFWDQCQHGSWYFPPWHRGYLVSIENMLRNIITNDLGGPSDWALPYWNYLNQSTENPENNIPPAFTVQQLPDGTPNPLFVPERYGPMVPVGNDKNEANDECQWDTIYSDSDTKAQPGPGDLTGYFYGGGETGFSHSPDKPETGDLESNPHNFVHSTVGGRSKKFQLGLMAVPETAALDPIFYLHHANIDRMWAAWNETGKNSNSNDPGWLNGPMVNGNSQFAMPLNNTGAPWYYTPADVQNTNNLNYNGTAYAYTYDDLSLTSYDTTPPSKPSGNLSLRLMNLGAIKSDKSIVMANKRNKELVGANSGPVTLSAKDGQSIIKLDKAGWKSVAESLVKASNTNIPDEVYLQLEGVRGGGDSSFLSVYVNDKFIKSVSLFGLLSASLKNRKHSGGLAFKFNITNIIDDLHMNNQIDVDSLKVEIKANEPQPEGGEITIERIGVYRVSQ